MTKALGLLLSLIVLWSCGCDSSQTPVDLPRYTILQSGDPGELHIEAKDSPYGLVISPWEKGHEIIVLPRGSGDVQRFQSKRIRFWLEGSEVKVEVLEQGVVDAGEI